MDPRLRKSEVKNLVTLNLSVTVRQWKGWKFQLLLEDASHPPPPPFQLLSKNTDSLSLFSRTIHPTSQPPPPPSSFCLRIRTLSLFSRTIHPTSHTSSPYSPTCDSDWQLVGLWDFPIGCAVKHSRCQR